MAYYSSDVIQKVKKIDLLTYLQNYDPDELVHFSRNTYTTKEHDSLKISNGMWYWFGQGFGGKSALDYLVKVKQKSFTEAVSILLDKEELSITSSISISRKQRNKFVMPARFENKVFLGLNQ